MESDENENGGCGTKIIGLFFWIAVFVGGFTMWNRCGGDSGTATSSSAKGAAGEYYWEGSFGWETIVTLNEDGTWKKQSFENGKENIDEYSVTSGTWKVETVIKGGVKNKKEYSVLVFNENKFMAFIFEDGCVSNLNDDIFLNSDFPLNPNGNKPFGNLYRPICRE